MSVFRKVLRELLPPVVAKRGRSLVGRPAARPIENSPINTPHGVFHFEDERAFRYLYQEVFEKRVLAFEPEGTQTYIIDGGANIGVTCRFWKHLDPEASILAFEPDDRNFELLKKNTAGMSATRLEKKALWTSDGFVNFNASGGEGGHVQPDADVGEGSHGVRTVRLAPFLDRKVDLLKLDIEGAELEVLKDSREGLANVERIFVEYHTRADERQALSEFFEILESAGFRLSIHVDVEAPTPFCKPLDCNGMDLLLNIFGVRVGHGG